MMVGKRPRPPMKRTTSMKEITFDVDPNSGSEQAPPSDPFGFRSLTTVLPRTSRNRRHSADFLETPDHFLRACFLCKRRLFPGRDIYMYRGDSAFCSLECRQQQMKKDDKKDKCSVASSRKESGVAASSATSSVGPPLSINGETVAAAAS